MRIGTSAFHIEFTARDQRAEAVCTPHASIVENRALAISNYEKALQLNVR
jgi:hypothetical protein